MVAGVARVPGAAGRPAELRRFAGAVSPQPVGRGKPPRRGVQARRQVERLGGGPERLVFELVIAPVLERTLGDHRAGEAQAGSAPELA